MAANGTRPVWTTEMRYEILTGQDGLDFVGRANFDSVVAETAKRLLKGAILAQGPGAWNGVLEHSWCVAVVGAPEEKVFAFVARLHRRLERAGVKQSVIKVNRWPVETVLVGFPENKPKRMVERTTNGRNKKNGHATTETI